MRGLPKLSPAEHAALDVFMAECRALLGERLLEARLFGSRARGEGHDESDLDIALTVVPGTRAQRYAVYDLAYDIGLAHHVTLSPILLESDTLAAMRAHERLLVRELDRDGVPLL